MPKERTLTEAFGLGPYNRVPKEEEIPSAKLRVVEHPCTECSKLVAMNVAPEQYDFYMKIPFICHDCGERLKAEARKHPPPEVVKMSDLYPLAMNPIDESSVFGRNR